MSTKWNKAYHHQQYCKIPGCAINNVLMIFYPCVGFVAAYVFYKSGNVRGDLRDPGRKVRHHFGYNNPTYACWWVQNRPAVRWISFKARTQRDQAELGPDVLTQVFTPSKPK